AHERAEQGERGLSDERARDAHRWVVRRCARDGHDEPEVERRPQRVELPEAAAVLELDRRRIAEARREAMRLVTEHRCKPVPTAGVHTLRLGEGARELE